MVIEKKPVKDMEYDENLFIKTGDMVLDVEYKLKDLGLYSTQIDINLNKATPCKPINCQT